MSKLTATPLTGKLVPGMRISAPGMDLDGGTIVGYVTPRKRLAKAKGSIFKPKATKGASKAKRAPKAAATPARTLRSGTKLETIVGMLKSPKGCTAAEVLAATNWPAVSMPQQARAAGLKLRTEKDGRALRYWAA